MKTLNYPDYPFTSRWISLPAGRMHYIDEGGGPTTIVFVHGTPTWSYEWRHLIRGLSSTSRIIAPDHLGFGLSDRPPGGDYSPEWHAKNFADFMERLSPGPVVLVVHDYGGPIALGVAQQHPELVTGVVIVNSWMWSFELDKEMTSRGRIVGGSLGRFLYRWINFSLRVLMPSAYGNRAKLTPETHKVYLERFKDRWSRGAVLWPLARALNGSSAFFRSLWEERARLSALPMLIVWGMKDSAFRPHQLARWIETYPHARVVRVEDAGHWPHEESPDRVAAAIESFLR